MTQTDAIQPKQSRSINSPIDGLILRVARRFGGSKAKELERFIKFAVVGTIGFIVDFGTVFILQSTVLPPTDANGERNTLNVAIATSIAFVAAVVSNFTWNRLWTYPDSRSRSLRRQLSQFALVSVSGWLARTVWIAAMYIPFGVLATSFLLSLNSGYTNDPLTEAKIGTFIAQFIGVFVVMIWNFFANRYWTYNDVD